MAAQDEIETALMTLVGAGLRNSPNKDQLGGIVESWLRLLVDLPGKALVQGARVVASTDEFWPTVRRVRDAASRAQAQAFQPTATTPSSAESREIQYYDWIASVVGGHYYCFESDASKPPKSPEPIFPAEVEAELQEIEERTGGIYGQAEYDRVHELTGAFLQEPGRGG